MNIVGILDLDGFFVQKTFFCRELGIITHRDTYGTSFHFNTPLSYEKLNEKDKIQAKFLQQHIHGLSLSDENAMVQDMLDIIAKRFYTAYKMKNESVLGYKGGFIEKDLLFKLNIPSINLELFGCPKAVNIFPEMAWLESCGEHKFLKNKTDAYKHCPRVEVEVYLHWLTKYWLPTEL
jgi:hypothetical protein